MWNRIELHCHTLASDGDMSPAEIVALAIKRQYKSIAICDHNTTSNIAPTQLFAKDYPITIIPAIEWTTFWGHIVISGGYCHLDWRTITKDNIDTALQYAVDCGDIVTLAHPKRIGTPLCGGCYNHFDIGNWSAVAAVEVWSHFYPNTDNVNAKAFEFWFDLLSKGINCSAVYGYDWHCPDDNDYLLPYAYTYVDSASCDPKEILQAIKNHHTYITMGIEIDCHLTNELNESFGIGDTIKSCRYTLTIKATHCDDYKKHYSSTIQTLQIVNATTNTTQSFSFDGNSQSISVTLESGLIFLQISGLFENENAPLVITSAWQAI